MTITIIGMPLYNKAYGKVLALRSQVQVLGGHLFFLLLLIIKLITVGGDWAWLPQLFSIAQLSACNNQSWQ